MLFRAAMVELTAGSSGVSGCFVVPFVVLAVISTVWPSGAFASRLFFAIWLALPVALVFLFDLRFHLRMLSPQDPDAPNRTKSQTLSVSMYGVLDKIGSASAVNVKIPYDSILYRVSGSRYDLSRRSTSPTVSIVLLMLKHLY